MKPTAPKTRNDFDSGPVGERVVTGSLNNTAKVWDAATGREAEHSGKHVHQGRREPPDFGNVPQLAWVFQG